MHVDVKQIVIRVSLLESSTQTGLHCTHACVCLDLRTTCYEYGGCVRHFTVGGTMAEFSLGKYCS